MNRLEISKLYVIIKKLYPQYSVPADEESLRLYEAVLGDVDFNTVSRNLMEFVKTDRRYPTIADLRGNLEEDAYAQYLKVLHNEKWHRFDGVTQEAEQAMRAVGITKSSENTDVIKARTDYMKVYNLEVSRRKKQGIPIGTVDVPKLEYKLNTNDRFSNLPKEIRVELERCGVIEGQDLNCGEATPEQIKLLKQHNVL